MRLEKSFRVTAIIISLILFLALFTGCQGYKKGNVILPEEYRGFFKDRGGFLGMEMHSRTENVGVSAVNDDYELRVEYVAYGENWVYVFGKIILSEGFRASLMEGTANSSIESWRMGETLLAREIMDSDKYLTIEDYEELRADYLAHVGWSSGGGNIYLDEENGVMTFMIKKRYELSIDSVDNFSLAVSGLVQTDETGYEAEDAPYLSDKMAIVSWEQKGV